MQWAEDHAKAFMRAIYPPHFPLKEDMFNPTVGLNIFCTEGELCWEANVHSVGDSLVYKSRSRQAPLTNILFCPPCVLEGAVYGGLARCRQLASNATCTIRAASRFYDLLLVHGKFPVHVIERCFKL